MVTVQISLPDKLAAEAERAGLLSSDRIEHLVREELDKHRIDALFRGLERLDAEALPAAMSAEEVSEELAAMRAERRAASSS